MGKYIDVANITAALPLTTLLQLADDDDDGILDTHIIEGVIDDAEAEVEGYLLPTYPDISTADDRLVRLSVKEIAISFLFRRHPEYVRTFGEDKRTNGIYDRAIARLNRLQNAEQQLPDENATGKNPKNSGGIIYDNSHRMFIDNADGTSNSGDW